MGADRDPHLKLLRDAESMALVANVNPTTRKPEIPLYTALAAYTFVVASHLLWFTYRAFCEGPALIAFDVPMVATDCLGISLVWFLLRGYVWARYALASFTSPDAV